MTQLAFKNIETAITNILHMLRNVEENMNMMRLEIEDINMTQMKLLRMKENIITKMKNIMNEISRGPHTAEERSVNLEM